VTQRWSLPVGVDVPAALSRVVGGHPLVARILAVRGMIEADRAAAFLDPSRYVPSPPGDWPELVAACDAVRAIIARGGRIRVWGDPDADGITATAVLYEALVMAGARADFRMPTRGEGHGLAMRAVKEAHADGVGLLITVDTGIGDADCASRARELGVRTVITDHHDLPERLPYADVLVNNKMLPDGHPLGALSGAGLAYMLGVALLGEERAEVLLDLTAIGLIADLVPLVDDARYLAQRGLMRLRHTQRAGLLSLMEVASVDRAHADERDVAFSIAPALNAIARLDDSALGVRLLTTEDASEARTLAERADALNRERRARADAALAAAEEQLRRDPDIGRAPAIFVRGEGWDGGTLGLVAGTLARRYDRPAFVFTGKGGGTLVASARSVPGVDVHEAIVSQRHLLLREGGHAMAAGFSLVEDRLNAFRAGITRHLEDALHRRPPQPGVKIDAVLRWDELSLALARDLERLAPFGPGNPAPVLLLPAARVVRTEEAATAGRRRASVYVAGGANRGLWLYGEQDRLPDGGAIVDLAVELRVNRWRGRERLQLHLVEHRPAEGPVHAAAVARSGDTEVLDLRGECDVEGHLAGLRRRYGDDLLLWSEGHAPVAVGADRTALRPGYHVLVVAWAPPGPRELALALERAQPRLVVLLPVSPAEEVGAREFLRALARLVGVTLGVRGGLVDAEWLAAQMGARLALVEAGLRYLEVGGRVRLGRDGGRLVVSRAADGAWCERTISDRHRAERALEVIQGLLQETSAYRRAYATESLGVLLAGRH